MIELTEVHKVYGREGATVTALRDVSLRIGRGDYVALLGPSGSGKSTLMHILGCLDRPTRGRYRLEEDDVAGMPTAKLADVRNRKIGFVFQRFHLLPRSTAVDNAALPLRFSGVSRVARQRRARDLLTRLGLGDRLDHRPGELSGGEQQRVAIARALVNDPTLLLADEPTGNLDSKAGAGIVELLEEQCAAGRTLVVVTHDEALAQRARRVIRLLDGAVVADERSGSAGQQPSQGPQ